MDIWVYIAPLTYILLLQIALERSTTARQAIQMMGDLATELGFYAADWVGGDASKGKREQDFVIFIPVLYLSLSWYVVLASLAYG